MSILTPNTQFRWPEASPGVAAKADRLNRRFANRSAVEVLRFALTEMGRVAMVSSFGAYISFLSTLFFIFMIFYAFARGRQVEANPWGEGATTLEWTLPTPPPEHTFEILPKQEEWDKGHSH